MTTTTFDTLAYAKRLREAGVPEPQAEAQSAALADALRQNAGELATIADLRVLDLRLTIKLGAMLVVAVVVLLFVVVIQWLTTHNPLVAGSSPTGPTKFKDLLGDFQERI